MSASRKREKRSLARRRRQTSRTICSPSASWPMNVMRPSARTSRVAGLPMSCSERAEAQRLAARELVAERLGQHAAHARGVRRRTARRGAVSTLDLLAEHLERVVVDVEVVVVALLDAVERGQLGQHGRRARRAGRPARARRRRRRRSRAGAARAKTRSPAASVTRGAAALREALGLGIRREAQLGREARQPQRPQRVALVGLGAEHAQRAVPRGRRGRRAGRSGRPRAAPSRVERATHRARHRVDREVAPAQVVSRSSRPAAARSRRRDPPVRSITRQAPNASDSRNTGPRTSAASARAARAGSPATATSTSRTGRPSSSSRSAPPTIQASVTACAGGAPAASARR